MQCELQDKCELFGTKCEPSVNASMVGCSEFKQKPPSSDGPRLATGYVRCVSPCDTDCEYRRETYQNVYDGIFTESEKARFISELTQLLQEALPHIECKTKEQDVLITKIGELIST